MNRLLALVLLAVTMAMPQARAEFLQMDLSIFGMD